MFNQQPKAGPHLVAVRHKTPGSTNMGGYAQQTIMHMDLLVALGVMNDQTFKRLHHLGSATVRAHRRYCAQLIGKGSDFRQSPSGEPNRNVCRRLGIIADALSARVLPVGRDEIDVLIQQALRAYPL